MDIGRGWEVESTGHPDVAPELFLAHLLYLVWGGVGSHVLQPGGVPDIFVALVKPESRGMKMEKKGWNYSSELAELLY